MTVASATSFSLLVLFFLQTDIKSPMGIPEIIIELSFVWDIWMNFRSAYYDEDGFLESRPSKVAMKYFKGWFIVDALTIIPFDRMEAQNKDSATAILKAAK